MHLWKTRKEAIAFDLAEAERRAKAIQAKLDRLDEAFLFERSIDIDVYDRHAEKLRQELTLLRVERHASELVFPDGIAFDGNRFVGTGATAPAFSYLREIRTKNEGLVDQMIASWNGVAAGSGVSKPSTRRRDEADER